MTLRGRPGSQNFAKISSVPPPKPSVTFHQRRGSVSSNSTGSKKNELPVPRPSFTRSRSPAVNQMMGNGTTSLHRTGSPSQFTQHKNGMNRRSILPPVFQVSLRLPFSQTVRKVSMDSSKACEVVLLVGSLSYVARVLSTVNSERWTSIGTPVTFIRWFCCLRSRQNYRSS